jgi:hypothetical protein
VDFAGPDRKVEALQNFLAADRDTESGDLQQG